MEARSARDRGCRGQGGTSSAESRSLVDALTKLGKGASRVGGAKAAAKGAAKDVLRKAEPDAVAAARSTIARRAGQAAERLPASVRTGAKIGARGATLPVRRPFTTPLAAEALPAATGHGSLRAALEGKGAFATLTHGVAGAIGSALPGEAGKLAEEAIEVPAAALPTVYLTGKAGVKAAAGNPSELQALWKQYEKSGLLPALAEGNPSAALGALKHRPLWSLLEASGAASAAGRGLGAVARAGSHDRVGGLVRPDLTVPGQPGLRQGRSYSRDLFRQAAQRLHDRRTGNTVDLTTRSGREKRSGSPRRLATGWSRAGSRRAALLSRMRAASGRHSRRSSGGAWTATRAKSSISPSNAWHGIPGPSRRISRSSARSTTRQQERASRQGGGETEPSRGAPHRQRSQQGTSGGRCPRCQRVHQAPAADPGGNGTAQAHHARARGDGECDPVRARPHGRWLRATRGADPGGEGQPEGDARPSPRLRVSASAAPQSPARLPPRS